MRKVTRQIADKSWVDSCCPWLFHGTVVRGMQRSLCKW